MQSLRLIQNKIQHTFMIKKNFKKLVIDENLFSMINTIHEKLTINMAKG